MAHHLLLYNNKQFLTKLQGITGISNASIAYSKEINYTKGLSDKGITVMKNCMFVLENGCKDFRNMTYAIHKNYLSIINQGNVGNRNYVIFFTVGTFGIFFCVMGIIINLLRKQNKKDSKTLKDISSVSPEICKEVYQQISGIQYECDNIQAIVNNFDKIKENIRKKLDAIKPNTELSDNRWDVIRRYK
jgi:hypothetical protein